MEKLKIKCKKTPHGFQGGFVLPGSGETFWTGTYHAAKSAAYADARIAAKKAKELLPGDAAEKHA